MFCKPTNMIFAPNLSGCFQKEKAMEIGDSSSNSSWQGTICVQSASAASLQIICLADYYQVS